MTGHVDSADSSGASVSAPPAEPDPLLDATAQRYATQLLDELGVTPLRPPRAAVQHPAVAWAYSGLMTLTGDADGEPQLLPLALASCADGALAALVSLAPRPHLDAAFGSRLLAERAAFTGHRRAGAISPNGSCRLLEAADGCLALNLPREDDRELLSAWLETQVPADRPPDWAALQTQIGQHAVEPLVERARLLGLAAAVAWRGRVQSAVAPACPAFRFAPVSTRIRAPDGPLRAPRVLDLSSLWAGPLCTHLLQQLGADVVKLESPQRPDGARGGSADFFDLLNAGKRCIALDWRSAQGRQQLHALLQAADIVIEASRPRALRQIGIDAEALLRERPALSWISLTGYGREAPQSQWIAYGDDAGVAAGLSACMAQLTGRALIVGDAVADPLSGLHAALAAWAGWLRASVTGRGAGLVSLPLAGVVARCAAFERPADVATLRLRAAQWRQQLQQQAIAPAPPQARPVVAAAHALGADNAAVFADWGLRC